MERHERIEKAIINSGKTKSEIAIFCGVAPAAITQWIKGESKNLKLENLYKLAEVTGYSAKWLAIGEGIEKNSSEIVFNLINQSSQIQYNYPILTSIDIDAYVTRLTNIKAQKYHLTLTNAGVNGFWYQVESDSMSSCSGMSIPKNALILINPELPPQNGQCIIAQKDKEIIFRQLIFEAGIKYLKPFNMAYKMLELDNQWNVIGTVIKAEIMLLPD